VRFYSKLIPRLAKEIIQDLTRKEHIEVEAESVEEAREDLIAIMREYQIQVDGISAEAKTILIRRNWPRSKMSETMRMISGQRKLPLGDDGVDYVINQMLEFMLISNNVEEVYAGDHVMRKCIITIFRKYMKMDEEVDKEARARLRHIEEGTSDWEIQYPRTVEQIRRIKGLI
jgi:hypothetical protein